MIYRWRDVQFDTPAGRDDSTLVIIDTAVPPKWNLNCRLEDLPPGPAAFATYLASLEPSPGAALTEKETREVQGRETTVLHYELKLADGTLLKQRQALIHEKSQVYVVTMTATPAGEKSAAAAFKTLLETFTWEKQ